MRRRRRLYSSHLRAAQNRGCEGESPLLVRGEAGAEREGSGRAGCGGGREHRGVGGAGAGSGGREVVHGGNGVEFGYQQQLACLGSAWGLWANLVSLFHLHEHARRRRGIWPFSLASGSPVMCYLPMHVCNEMKVAVLLALHLLRT
ncbi:hypothetical protein HPP92_010033 [Vanilla planifolia]|uniref:Uncharacterized protein n=1 Tax=Vanilla planifolia TaxID=51239 RepID=A0A835R4D4_VANPL|nr:hypothetical protein HPP92_010033 [Vanilla planifolia]